MNTLLRKLVFIGMGVAFFTACKKDQAIDYFEGGTAPALTASLADSIPLSYATASQNAVTFSWANPNYQFGSGVSSQDVSYLLEIDTVGANFTNPNRESITISKDLSLTITQLTFNSYLLNQLLLVAGVKHSIQVRVTASINSVAATNLSSNVLTFAVTPYAIPPAVAPPASGTLFIVGGDAKLGAWSNPVPTPAQQFTQVSTTEYKITIALSGGDPTSGGDQFLILPVNGSWANKYACVAANNTSAGGTFGYNWNDNFPGPTAAGSYIIDVNFQTGKYTVTKQ
jgi:hypothetical protein